MFLQMHYYLHIQKGYHIIQTISAFNIVLKQCCAIVAQNNCLGVSKHIQKQLELARPFFMAAMAKVGKDSACVF